MKKVYGANEYHSRNCFSLRDCCGAASLFERLLAVRVGAGSRQLQIDVFVAGICDVCQGSMPAGSSGRR